MIIEVFRLKCPEWSRVIVNATQSTRFVAADFKGNQLNLICFHLAEVNKKDEETCILSDKVDHLRLASTNRAVAYPQGLKLIENFITPEDESRIINRLLSFEKSRLAKRSILQFGRKIDFATKRYVVYFFISLQNILISAFLHSSMTFPRSYFRFYQKYQN